MTKIIRTPTSAKGGITPDEKMKLDAHAQLWIDRAMRTEEIDPATIGPAIERLYAAAGLKTPRVVIAPSPLVMAFAYGASAAIWHTRKIGHGAATRAATDAATDAATYDATRAATYDATYDAAGACLDLAGPLGVECARTWYLAYQGGNMWVGYECFLSACRDVLGLRLPEHEKYEAWEACAIHGGFRVMHDEFCIVSDFPEFVRVDDQHRPHCADGPSHRWRDGWSIYHWHGVRVPAHWIEGRVTLTSAEIFKEENAEVRRAGCEIIGWGRVLEDINAELLDDDGDPQIGTLYAGQIPGATPCTFLKVQCGTGRQFVIPTAPGLKTAIEAQAWIANKPVEQWVRPEVRG